MKYESTLKWIVPVIFLLALFAASMGLFYHNPGQPYQYTNHRGERVMLNGQGLYFYDTVSIAAQQQGNDIVTLAVGLPLLAFSAWLAFRGSVRGRLLMTGTIGFFLYTYLSVSMLTAYNALFLVYVALFSLSLYAFILCMMSFDLRYLPRYFSSSLPRRTIAGLLFFVAGFLLLAWLGRIVTPWWQNQTPILENATTLVIQVLDLGLIVPLAILSAVLLLRDNSWGYLLSSVMILKFLTMGLAVSAMAINMTLRGVGESLGIIVPFLVITLLNAFVAVVLLRNVDTHRGSLREA